jgi:NIPSNAP
VKTNDEPPVAVPNRWKLNGWTVCSTALVSCFVGFLGALTHANETKVDSHRVFELRIYHAVPGKVAALESVFRDASKIMANHGINVIGYWVANEDPAWKDTFIYIVAHPSREEAKKNWDALHADPTFRPYIEAAKPLIDKADKVFRVDEVYMRPTDFSSMR